MPISPKVFYSHSTRSRLCRFASSLAFSVLYLTVGLLGFLFGSITISRPLFSSSGCIAFKTRSISVVWEKVTGGSEFESGSGSGSYSGVVVKERHKVMGFVGIQTGFAFTGRRRSLRKTWFPSDREGLTRLAFFKAAYALFDSDFYVKTDDDIYLRPDRLSLLLAKECFRPQTYIGCMKKGPVFTDPKLKCLVGVIWMSIST